MSNTLGIFGNLTGYLAAADSNQDTKNNYYLQKFYQRDSNLRDDDVAPEFTDAVVEMARKFREIDLSTSARHSLKTLLINAVKKIAFPDSGKKNIIEDLKNVIEKSPLMESDKENFNSKINNLPNVSKDSAVSIVEKWISDNYETEYVTGAVKNSFVQQILTALHDGKVGDEELGLFNKYMDVMPADGSRAFIKPSELDLNRLGDYRINIKNVDIDLMGGNRAQYGGAVKVPKVVLDLPDLQPGNRVGYNKLDIKVVSSPKADLLKRVFQETYSTGKPSSLPGFTDSQMLPQLRPDMLKLMNDILTRKTTPSAHISETETEKIDEELKRANWRRVGENVWKTELADGTSVTYDPSKPEYGEQLSEQINNCPAVGFGNDVDKCRRFLTDVANNNNHKDLGILASTMNEDVKAEVISKLHPKYALAILKAFGFRRKICSDSVAGRQIEKVQRVEEWKKNFINKKFETATANIMKTNIKLMNFLDLLAQLVNSNPSILNDSYVGETEESTGKVEVPKDLAERKIVAATSRESKRPVNSWTTITDRMNKIYGSFSKGLTFDGVRTSSPFGMDNLFPSMILPTSAVVGSTWGSMVGGGEKVFLAEHNTAMDYSHNVGNILRKLLENLTNLGKDLSKEDLEIISKKLADFDKLEKELFETAKNIQTYSQLLRILETENRKEIITTDHIKKYTEKYNHLLGRYEKTGSTLNTLVSLLNDCAGDDGKNCDTNGEL